MSYRVVITTRARDDALAAFQWLAERSPDAAERWYSASELAIADLERNPAIHPVAEEESEQVGLLLRQALVGRGRGVHRIFFSIRDDVVTIHYVRHAARGPIEED